MSNVFCRESDDKWLDAHYDPVASLYTFTQCIALADINADGENKLIIADLGTGMYDMKLKVYKGEKKLRIFHFFPLSHRIIWTSAICSHKIQ